MIRDADLHRSGHIRELWDHFVGRVGRMQNRRDLAQLFLRFQQHRDGVKMNPFRDWSVNDRYRADGVVRAERLHAHHQAAELCLSILSQVEQSYLGRSRTPGAAR